MSNLNWFERRRFERAITDINTIGELSFDDVFDRVKPSSRDALIYALAHAIYDKRISVRYDAVVEGIFAESQTSVLDFSDSIDIFKDVEAVYVKAA